MSTLTTKSPGSVTHLGGDLIPHLSLVAGTPEGERPAEDMVAGLVGDLLVDCDGDRVAETCTNIIIRNTVRFDFTVDRN